MPADVIAAPEPSPRPLVTSLPSGMQNDDSCDGTSRTLALSAAPGSPGLVTRLGTVDGTAECTADGGLVMEGHLAMGPSVIHTASPSAA